MKVKATSAGTPPLSGAEAFARLLVAVVEKKPVLRVVEKTQAPMPETCDDRLFYKERFDER